MGHKIAIVSIKPMGGVATSIDKLYRGLLLSGEKPQLISLGDKTPRILYNDLRAIRALENFDAIIYMGLPSPDYLLVNHPATLLFLQGFMNQESIGSILNDTFRRKVSSAVTLGYRLSLLKLVKPDVFVCCSKTTCEANAIKKDCVILPQFYVPNELDHFNNISADKNDIHHDIVRLMTYLPSVYSPRLLTEEDFLELGSRLTKLVSRSFEMIIVTPRQFSSSASWLKVFNYLPRSQFLSLLASADLYIERCVDEELGYSTLEAGLLGVPVGKATSARLANRCDYDCDEIISSSSIEGLSESIAEYVNGIDQLKAQFSNKFMKFVRTNRSWNAVKDSLMQTLNVVCR